MAFDSFPFLNVTKELSQTFQQKLQGRGSESDWHLAPVKASIVNRLWPAAERYMPSHNCKALDGYLPSDTRHDTGEVPIACRLERNATRIIITTLLTKFLDMTQKMVHDKCPFLSGMIIIRSSKAKSASKT